MPENTAKRTGTRSAPLSPFQRIWLADQQENDGPLQVTFTTFRLDGPLNVELTERVLGELWRRHETLRTISRRNSDISCLRIAEDSQPDLSLVNLEGRPRSEQEAAVEQIGHEAVTRPIDHAAEPAVRVTLVRMGRNLHLLLLAAHPIACDAISTGLFGEEFTRLYEVFASGGSAAPPESGLQYRDFVKAHRRWLRNEQARRDIKYWRGKLAGLSGPPRDFGDQAPSARPGFAVGVERSTIPASLCKRVHRLAKDHRVDLETTLLAVFQVLLHRYSGDDHVPVGVVVSGRRQHKTRKLIGCFVNHLILQAQFPAGLTLATLLDEAFACRVRAAEHATLSLQTVLEECLVSAEVNGHRSMANHRDLFRTVFSMREVSLLKRSFSGLVLTQLDVDEPLLSCDLAMRVAPDGRGLAVKLVYNRSILSADFAARISRHFINALTTAVEQPNLPVERLPPVDIEEHRQVTIKWHGIKARFRQNVCLHELFEAQVRHTPRACAVVHQDRRLSFNELDGRANKLARYLRQFGVRPDTIVAICLEPSVELLVAILAVLKAGGAYTPISPSTPTRRIQFLLKDSQAPIFITRESFITNGPELPCRLILIDEHATDIERERAEPIVNEATPDNLAYVIYTSGSTGTPKGVMVPHHGICNTLQWRQATLTLHAADRVLLTLSFTFDASISQLFHPLLAGTSLVIPEVDHGGDPARIVASVRRHRISVLGAPTSWWRLLVEEPDFARCNSIRIAYCGGEPLPEYLPEQVRAQLGVELHNMYGPTEASMEASRWTCAPATRVSIGRPIANTRAYVLDPRLQPMPIGVAGELYLGGAGLARGYLNNPARTAEQFLPDPFAPSPGERMYRTGDICRWLPNGCLEYLGRHDRQIKIYGHRIELEEIEAVLQGCPAVHENVVVLRADQSGAQRLVGYVVPNRARAGAARAEELRRYLGSQLPRYMIPSLFVFLESLPRATTGKLDRRALPAPHLAPSPEASQDRSGRPLERFLASLWGEVLKVRVIGDHDNFFELGGNSIHATILAHKLEETLGEFVYTVAVYDAPTIDALARYLRLNYSRSVARLFGQDTVDRVAPLPDSAVDQASISALKNLIRTLPERANGTPASKNPSAVFILSPPRSGSTLLRVMLGGHPSLFAPPELQLLNYNTLPERKAALSSERDSFWLQGTIRALMELCRCDVSEATRIMSDCEQGDMSVQEFYRFMQEKLKNITLVDKTPVYSLDLQTLKRAEEDFENARYIHLVRHPSSVVASFEEAKLHVFFAPFLKEAHDFATSQLAELVWDVSHQNILEFLRVIPVERRHLVRFEELVRHPKKTMMHVAGFLGLPFHPNMTHPYGHDQRSRMTDAIHPMARMLGDVKFHGHGKIKPETAQRGRDRYPEEVLGEATRKLARRLGYKQRDRQGTTLVGLETRGRALAFFCVHPAGGAVSCYHDLVRRLGPNQPFYVFRPASLDEAASRYGSVRELASTYVQEMRNRQPRGPYQLGGWSFGGVVAFEMALQLAASGEEIALLTLFSSYLHQPGLALPPPSLHDFVLEFFREHGLNVQQNEAGESKGRSRERYLRYAFAQAKRAGIISRELAFNDFRRVMIQHARLYRAHVQIARRYVPRAQAGRVILFEAADRSLDGHGVFLDWDAMAAHVLRHTVRGNHFTMLREPNVRHVAACLTQHLQVVAP